MIELQDNNGRLIVVLPVRLRHFGNRACVFVDGRVVGEFPSAGEAARYARSLAQVGSSEPKEEATVPGGG